MNTSISTSSDSRQMPNIRNLGRAIGSGRSALGLLPLLVAVLAVFLKWRTLHCQARPRRTRWICDQQQHVQGGHDRTASAKHVGVGTGDTRRIAAADIQWQDQARNLASESVTRIIG